MFSGGDSVGIIYPDLEYCDVAQRKKREFVLVYKPVKTGCKPAKFLDRKRLFRYIEIAEVCIVLWTSLPLSFAKGRTVYGAKAIEACSFSLEKTVRLFVLAKTDE